MQVFLTIALLTACLLQGTTPASAFFFERRPRPEAKMSYFIYPVSGQIPGVAKFSGIGVSAAQLFGTEADLSVFKVSGNAEHYQGSYQAELVTAFDIPLLTNHLNLSFADLNVKNGAWPEGERGMRSNPDSFYYLLGEQFKTSGADLSLQFFDYQLEAYYGYANSEVVPFGLIDPQGTLYSAENSRIIKEPRGHRVGIYLDDTDHRRDPRIGYRVQIERWTMPQTREENASYYQNDYNLSFYVPNQGHDQVVVINGFLSTSTVIDQGKVQRKGYQCPPDIPQCQTSIDELYRRQRDNAEKGKSTSLGGTMRLRGYPTNRFYDAYSAFWGIELRNYWLEQQKSFNYLIEKGIFTSLQTAVFYEEGTVAPNQADLWKDRRNSFGVGLRLIFQNVIGRADLGHSDEGSELSLFVGYPF